MTTTRDIQPALAARPLVPPRAGAAALALAGLLFLLYPALRPWNDESTAQGALDSMSSTAWVFSHLFAMIGFILVPLGIMALQHVMLGSRGERPASASVVATWLGSGLVLPFYGAEDFGLNAIALHSGGQFDILAASDTLRFGTVQLTMFFLGLALLATGAVLAAVAIWRSGRLARFSGVPFALGFILFAPQFAAPPAVRIAHGLLIAVGLLWMAVEAWRAGSARTRA